MDSILERAKQLKQSLLEFVLDAEGELATALETHSAEHLARFAKSQYQGGAQTDLVIDRFLTAGCVGDQTPLSLFLAQEPDLDLEEKRLLKGWSNSFTGLFVVTQVLTDGFELKNWLTAKHYHVKAAGLQSPEQTARLKEGEIVLTRIAPIADPDWMLFSSLILMGKLGKPKLAVAIGNFRQHYPEDLYGDAPELVQEAWRSVEQYHLEWLDFFGSEEVTLPGYQVNPQFQRFQESVTQRRLAAAGLDGTHSLSELASKAGFSETDIAEAAQDLGANAAEVEQLLKPNQTSANPATEPAIKPATTPEMVAPQLSVPDAIKKAEQVTLLTHPQWGQVYLSSYPQMKARLEQQNPLTEKDAKLVRQCLENAEMNTYLWRRLADQYPTQLEGLLQTALEKPTFSLTQDLEPLLQSFGKPLNPVLPETASVPIHLHNLFQDVLREVQKTQAKAKGKPKTGTGFQRGSSGS